MHQAYKTFLTTLAESKTGQTYESLQWAGEGLLTLDAYQDAEKVFRRVLTEFTAGPPVPAAARRPRQAAADPAQARRLRCAVRSEFDEADIRSSTTCSSRQQSSGYIETLFEKGMLLEAEAEAGKGTWSAALGILGRPRQEAGAGRTAVRRLLRRLVSRGLGPLQAEGRDEGTPDAPGRDAALAERRRSRDEGEISRVARANPMNIVRETTDGRSTSQSRPDPGSPCKLAAASLAIAWCGAARADDVNLISGTTFKQAIGGRVRGQVQSESPSEVVVLLGATTTTVPTDQIQSIRYDGQSAIIPLAEARESSGQLAEAAELFKKAATESAGKPFPLPGRPVSRGRGPDRAGPGRAGPRQGSQGQARQVPPGLSDQPPHRRCACLPGPAPVACRRFRRGRGHHRRARQAAQGSRARGRPPHQDPGQAGQASSGDRRARQADRQLSQGLGTAPGGPARQGREPRRHETVQGSRDLAAER